MDFSIEDLRATPDFQNLNSIDQQEMEKEYLQQSAVSVVDNSILSQKQQTARITSDFKNKFLASRTIDKQEQHYSFEKPIEESYTDALVRGGVEAVKGVPNLAWGVAAGASAIAETVTGPGGVATKAKKYTIDKYTAGQQDISSKGKPEDSFTYSYERAKEGDLKALVSWAAHGTGYVSAQLATMLTGVGIIEKGTELLGKKAVGQVMKSLVKKEANRVAEQALITQGVKVTTEAIAKTATTDLITQMATKTITKKVGQQIGMGTMSFGMEGGEIGGDLAQQTVEDGNRTLTGAEIGKGLTATALAGSVEYLELLLGLKAITGKLGKIPGGKDINGLTGRAVRGTVTAGKVAPLEAVQEYAQTGLEQWGTGKDLMSKEAKQERIDAAALGALGAVPGAGGAVLHKSEQEQLDANSKKKAKQELRTQSHPQEQFDYKTKVKEAVKAKDATKYSDPKSKDYSPLTAIDILQKINKEEDTTTEQKITNHDKVIEINETLGKAQVEVINIIKKYKGIEEERKLTKEEKIILNAAYDKAESISEITKQVIPLINSMNQKEEIPDTVMKDIKASLQSNDTTKIHDAIINIFGSKGAIEDAEIETILNNPKIGDLTKKEVKNIQTSNASSKAVTEAQKSPSNKTAIQVHNDIIHGNAQDGFKGIENYKQAIAVAIQNKNLKLAIEQLKDLKAFTVRHAKKAQVFRRIQDAVMDIANKNNTLKTADFNALEQYNKERLSRRYKNEYHFSANFEPSIQAMELEATALSDAIIVAENMITPVQPSTEETVQEEVDERVTTKASAEGVTGETTEGIEQSLNAEQVKKDTKVKPLDQLPLSELQTMYQQTDKADTVKRKIIKKIIRQKQANTKKGEKDASQTESSSPVETEIEVEASTIKDPKPINKMSLSELRIAWKEAMDSGQEELAAEIHGHVIKRTEERKDEFTPLGQELTTSEKLPEDTHPGMLNPIREFFKAKPIKKGVTLLLQQTANIMSDLSEKYLSKFTDLFSKQPLDENAIAAAESIQKFSNKFNVAVEEVFKPKQDLREQLSNETDAQYKVFISKQHKRRFFRKEDPIQYLLNDQGKFAPNTLNAMMGVAYKYLATQASGTIFNTTDAIIKILKLPADSPITNTAHTLMGKIGVPSAFLAEQLGKEIFPMLGIEAIGVANHNQQTELEISLGLQTIAVLQFMKHMNPTYVYTGYQKEDNLIDSTDTPMDELKTDDGNVGLLGLRNSQIDPTNDLYKAVTNQFEVPIGTDGKPKPVAEFRSMAVFYRVASSNNSETGNREIHKQIQNNIIKPFSKSKQMWDLLFNGQRDKKTYSWVPFKKKVKDERILKKTKDTATVKQSSNLQNNENDPWEVSSNTMNTFLFLDQENQEKILGKLDLKNTHVENRKHTEGVNFQVSQSLVHINNWLTDAAIQVKSYASKFFIREEFARHTRMQQIGFLNPQGDKAHRFLFNMSQGKKTFDTTKAFKEDGEITEYQQFMEAVALSLDIEAGKVGGMEAAVAMVEKELNTNADFQNAITAIRQLLDLANFQTVDPEAMLKLQVEQAHLITHIVDGVQAGKMKVHSLKGLVEYTRFLIAKENNDTVFKSDLATEIDGISNGPIMARLQLTLNITRATLTALQNGGLRFKKGMTELAAHMLKPLSHDAYRATGFAWASELAKIEKDTIDKYDTPAKKWTGGTTKWQQMIKSNLRQLQAMKNIVGEFRAEDGNVSDIVRKLSKDPTMRTIYGMGPAALIRELVALTKSTVYEKLEDIARLSDINNDQAVVDYNLLNQNIKDLTYTDFQSDTPVIVNGKINKEALLNIVLSNKAMEVMTKHIIWNHGKALQRSISSIYQGMQDAASTLNKGVGLAAAKYNVIYKLRIEQISKELRKKETDQGLKPYSLKMSVEQHKKIETDLKDMFPSLKTPFGGIIPLAKISNKKLYDVGKQKNEIRQSYKKSSGLIEKKGQVPADVGLENPRVRGVILGIHMEDATVANKIMGIDVLHLLNNHDGFTTGFLEATVLAKMTNKAFADTMNEYDLGKEIAASVERTSKRYNEEIEKLKINTADTYLHKEMYSMGTTKVYDAELGELTPFKVHYVTDEVKQTMIAMNNTATITARNKKMILSAVLGYSQYYYPGGEYTTGNEGVSEIAGIKVNEVTSETEQALSEIMKETDDTEKVINKLKMAIADNDLTKFGSKSGQTISVDPNEYGKAQEISSQNVLEIYEQIKDDSTVHDSPEHDNRLRHILTNLVQTVLQPVDLFMKTNPEIEPEGKFVTYGDRDRIFLSHQNQIIGPVPGALSTGIRMSSGEVYTHELLHAILESGLKHNHRLYTQVNTLYRIAYKEFGADGYKYFLKDPTIDVMDIANQYEVAAAKKRYNYIFRGETSGKTKTDAYTNIEQEIGSTNYLSEFLTIGLSNENFLKALTGIKLPDRVYTKSTWEDIQGGNIQQTLMNIAQKIFDFFYSKFRASKNKPDIAQELERLAVLLSKIDSNHKNKLFEAQSKIEEQYQKVADLSNNFIKKAVTSGPLKIVKNLRTLVGAYDDKDTLLGQALRRQTHWYEQLNYGLRKAIVTEFRGKTNRMAWLHQLLNRRGVYLDNAKTTISADTQKLTNSFFTEELTSEQKSMITKIGVQPDTVVLLSSLGLKGIGEILGEPNKLRLAIDAVINEIEADPKLTMHSTYYQRATDAMGHFMIHSRGRLDEEVIQNTWVIAELTNRTDVKVPLTQNQVNKAEGLVSRLGSLYALQHTAKDQRLQFKELIDTDPEGVRQVLAMHQVLKEDSLNLAFEDDKRKFIKGYTKEIINTRIDYQYGTGAEAKEYLQRGFTQSIDPIERDKDDPMKHIPIYVYTAPTGRINDFMSVILSFTGRRGKGFDSEQIARQMDTTTKDGKVNNAQVVFAKSKLLDKMADPSFKPKLTPGNFMIPQYDETGTIFKYRYMMAETTKDNYLEKVNDYDIIFGAMAGQIIDKERSPIINEELIDGLYVMFHEEYQENPGAFVEVGPNSPDLKLRDIYHMMPEGTKQYADSKWGGPSIFIPKDVLDISFGYRQYSIVEAFAKDPVDRARLEKIIIKLISMFGGEAKGVLRANNLENIMSELAQLAKNNIIVRSLSVTLNNFGSNIIFLKGKGVPTAMVFKLGWEAIAMGTKYQADIQKLGKLQIKQKMLLTRKNPPANTLQDITNEIMQMKAMIERNPTTQAIEAGLMPQLIDDVETTISGSNFPSDFEKAITKQTDKLPKMVQNVGKITFMTQDTQAYQVLNNAVKMTDFIGRYVLYNYYTSKARGKKQMKHEDAVAAVIEEFVNFAPPTHRMIEYLNTIGLLRFTKYGIRILKVIKDSAIDKPFDVAMAFLMSSHLGMDNINNSIPGVTKSMTANIGDPFSFMLDSLSSILPINTLRSFFGK